MCKEESNANKLRREAADRKKAETAAKKAEADRLLREEEAALPDKPKGAGTKQATRRPGINMDQLNDISASGVDNALEALKLTSGDQAVKIDRNPQRRKAAAYEAFKARRLPEVRADPQYRGLRLQQMVNQVHKEFEKSPENPMNNIGNVAYNAKQGDVKAVRSHVRENLETAYAGNPGKK